MKSGRRYFNLALFFLAPFLSTGAYADSMEINPIGAAAGIQGSYFACPCIRWVVRVEGPSGRAETKDFIFTIDEIFKVEATSNIWATRLGSKLFKLGGADVLWKEGHIGFGFQGVTAGDRIDRESTDIIQTGFYAFVNLLRRETERSGIRWDQRAGYDYLQQRVNLGREIERHGLYGTNDLKWHSGRWRGDVYVTVEADANLASQPELTEITTGAAAQVDLLRKGGFLWGLGAAVAFDHNPVRELQGLDPNDLSGRVWMEFHWIHKFQKLGGKP